MAFVSVIRPFFFTFILSATVFGGDGAVAAFREKMKSGSEQERIRAVNEAAAAGFEGVHKELRSVVSGDSSDRVRAAAALALGRGRREEDYRFLLSVIGQMKKRPVVLSGALDGLALFRDPRSVGPATDAAQHWLLKSRVVTSSALRVIGKVPHREAVKSLIKLLRLTYPGAGYAGGPDRPPDQPGPTSDSTVDTLQSYRPVILDGLRRITGEGFADIEDWAAWWSRNERTFKPAEENLDPNATLALNEPDRRYRIVRPKAEWRWIETPEKGFDRTAELKEDGDATVLLSILAYSNLERGPDTAAALLAQQKEELEASFARIEEQAWDGKVTVGGAEAREQKVRGDRKDGTCVKIRQLVFEQADMLYVLRVTCGPWTSREEEKSAEDFAESFTMIP
ncbi:MAG: hypothetical protein MUE73_10240 [Planctomycetes bacterium]|nr:hypothetical protein [Planctomycetota bacterium]